MRGLIASFLVLFFNRAMAQEAPDPASDPASDPAVYMHVVQLCQATDTDCVSVYRSPGEVLVTRGMEILTNTSIQAPPPVEPAVEIRTLNGSELGAREVEVVVHGTNFGPYRLEQGHQVAISPDGDHFALLERRGNQWWLVSDGRGHELPRVTQAMGARFATNDRVLVDALHGSVAETLHVNLAAASP